MAKVIRSSQARLESHEQQLRREHEQRESTLEERILLLQSQLKAHMDDIPMGGNNSELEKKIVVLEGKIADLSGENAGLTGKITGLSGENAELSGKNAELEGKNADLERMVLKCKALIKQKTGEMERLQRDLDEAKDATKSVNASDSVDW